MQLLNKEFPPNYNVFLMGDTHEGTVLQCKDAIYQTINMVLEPYDGIKNNYLIHHGDEIEAFTIDHKFYSTETSTEPLPLIQAKAVIKDFKPIRKNILAWLLGNHSWALHKFGNITKDIICKELGVEYGTYTLKYSFKDKKGNVKWKLYATHGRKSLNSNADDPVRRESNMKLQLKRYLEHKDASSIIMSRGHCLSSDTEILTSDGWKTYDLVNDNDIVLTFNTEKEVSEWQQITNKFIYENKYDTMIQCETPSINYCVTNDHTILKGSKRNKDIKIQHHVKTYKSPQKYGLSKGIYWKYGKYNVQVKNCGKMFYDECFDSLEEAKKVYEEVKSNIKKSFNRWDKIKAKEVLDIKVIEYPLAGKSDLKDFPLSDDYIRLLGWLIAEGHFRNNGAVQLFQRWENKDVIGNLLSNLNINYSIYRGKQAGRQFTCPYSGRIYTTKVDIATFYIKIKNAIYIRQLINKKEIPAFAFLFSDRQFELFLDALVQGDGCWSKSKNAGSYYTSNNKLADTLQALCVSHGWRAYKRIRKSGIVINFYNKSTVVIHSNNKKQKLIPYSNVKATNIVWCVSVPNETIMTRRKGKACFLGNSHKLLIVEPIKNLYLYDDGKNIKKGYTKPVSCMEHNYIPSELRWYVATGSYMKLFELGVSGYAEMAEHDPVEIGFAIVKVRDHNVVGVDKIIL